MPPGTTGRPPHPRPPRRPHVPGMGAWENVFRRCNGPPPAPPLSWPAHPGHSPVALGWGNCAEACQDRDSSFLPVLFTTFGGIVGSGKVFWTQLLRKMGASFLGGARARFIHQSRVALSHRLMCAVAAQLESLILVDDWTLAEPASATHAGVDQHGNLTTECGMSPFKRPRRAPSRPNRC